MTTLVYCAPDRLPSWRFGTQAVFPDGDYMAGGELPICSHYTLAKLRTFSHLTFVEVPDYLQVDEGL